MSEDRVTDDTLRVRGSSLTAVRSDARERRRRLRALDVALGEELEDAGALTFTELRCHVRDRKLLGRDVSDDTLWEWWAYALRRRLLAPREPSGPAEFGLTAEGRASLEARRVQDAVDLIPGVRRFLREVPPASWLTLGLSTAALAVASSAAVSAVIGLVLAVLIAFPLLALVEWACFRRIDAHLERTNLTRHVAWLDGDPLPRRGLESSHPAVDIAEMRRLTSPSLPDLSE